MKKRKYLIIIFTLIIIAVSYYPALGDEPITDEGTWLETALSWPITGLTKAMDLMGFEDIETLVFSQHNIFTGAVKERILDANLKFTVVAVFLLAMVLAYNIGTIGKCTSEMELTRKKEDFRNWALAMVMTLFFFSVVELMFQLNAAITGFAHQYATNFKLDRVNATGSVLGTAGVNLFFAYLKAVFNIKYLVCYAFIGYLLFICALVIWSISLRKAKISYGILLGELFSNIIMQSTDALSLVWLTGLIGYMPGKWWVGPVLVFLVLPFSHFTRNIINIWLSMFGLQEERMSSHILSVFTGGLSRAVTYPFMAARILRGGGSSGGFNRSFGGGYGPRGGPGGGGGSPGAGGQGQGRVIRGGYTPAPSGYSRFARGAGYVTGAVAGVAGSPFGLGQTFSNAGVHTGANVAQKMENGVRNFGQSLGRGGSTLNNNAADGQRVNRNGGFIGSTGAIRNTAAERSSGIGKERKTESGGLNTGGVNHVVVNRSTPAVQNIRTNEKGAAPQKGVTQAEGAKNYSPLDRSGTKDITGGRELGGNKPNINKVVAFNERRTTKFNMGEHKSLDSSCVWR